MNGGRSRDELWRAASVPLDEALDLPTEERQSFVVALRASDPELASYLEALLDEEPAVRAERFLEHNAQDLLADGTLAGQRFGAYTFVRPLGAGGMGTVWLAQRSDGNFEGQMAVKLLSAGLLGSAGIGRFRREGSILARLKHPHIAQLTDAGVSDVGQPFLVLEYVEGEPIDRYCDARALDLDGRLHLFLDVLAAVEHAHANLVIHRDVKPSNVMVSKDGKVKLLDFGIATLLESTDSTATSATREGGRAFTPAFASPEQVTGGTITTATDVYALGALLYLLLVGRHSVGDPAASPAELVKAIVETDPERPSDAARDSVSGAPARLRRALRRDLDTELDTLVGKALKKDPATRYASVRAFAEDIRRYLAKKPLAARPDTFGYRASRFVRRHRVPVALTCIGLAGVFVSLGVALVERADAIATAADLDRLTQAMLFKIHDQVRPLPGSLPAVSEIIKSATEVLDRTARNIGDDAERLRDLASGYERLATLFTSHPAVQRTLGRPEAGLESAERALAIRRRLGAREYAPLIDRIALARALGLLAEALQSVGRADEGMAATQESMSRFRVLEQRFPDDASLRRLAARAATEAWLRSTYFLGRREGEPELLADAAERWRGILERDPQAFDEPLFAEQQATRASLVLREFDQPDPALAIIERALATLSRTGTESTHDSWALANARAELLQSQAQLLRHFGRVAEARIAVEAAILTESQMPADRESGARALTLRFLMLHDACQMAAELGDFAPAARRLADAERIARDIEARFGDAGANSSWATYDHLRGKVYRLQALALEGSGERTRLLKASLSGFRAAYMRIAKAPGGYLHGWAPADFDALRIGEAEVARLLGVTPHH